jgi:RNA polymerase sigma-70 factor (ECF subfamily)
MLDMAVRTPIQTADDALRNVLLQALPAARRLATSILRDPVAAEDAVQEAALQAWKQRHGLRDLGAAEAWFNRILVNVCRRELNRRGRISTVTEIDPVGDDGRERFSQSDELARAIQRLAADEQIVLGLRYGRDMTVPQIAALIAKPQGTVKSRLYGAHEHLRAILESDRRLEESLLR